MSDKLNELYTLTQRAQKMELINEEIALQIYIEIFENYYPKISKTYESGIRLLEKRHRYEDALVICEKAISGIKEDQISGILERFEDTKSRLERKIEELAPKIETTDKKPIKLNLGIVIAIVLIITGASIMIFYVAPKRDVYVDLEGKEALEGGENFIGREKNPLDEDAEKEYPITQSMIEIARLEILKNQDVSDANVIPQGDTLGIAILVMPGTDEKRCKDLAIEFVKALSGAASAEYTELNGPTTTSLGDIYDYYELVISAGIGVDTDEIIARGTKNKGARTIFWRQ